MLQTWRRQASFFKWKARFDGLEVSDARKLKSLEDDNARLKKLLAEQLLKPSRLFTHPI